MKIKIIANNCLWPSWDQKIKELQDWFAPKISIQFDLTHTSFTNIPFKIYANADVATGSTEGLTGVDQDWYDENIVSYGIGYDIVIFVMNLNEWKASGARGWRTDSDQGPVQLQVGCDENEIIMWPNFPALNGFFQIARHEIMHALFMISGQNDVTHYWWNQGKLEVARDYVNLQKGYSLAGIQRAINYLLLKIFKINMEIQKLPPETPKTEPRTERLTKSHKLYLTAKECLGMDASPNDVAPDELGCAESINAVYKKAFGEEIGGGVSTYKLYLTLKSSEKFMMVQEVLPGDIIISPTGFGGKNGILHGHVGIVGESGLVMSNESKNGKFEINFTIESWRERYWTRGGYPVLFFRAI